MKPRSSLIALTLLTSIGNALSNQNAVAVLEKAGLPACSAECTVLTAPKFGCDPLAAECIASNAALSSSISLCVAQTCSVKEQLITLKVSAVASGAPVRNQGGLTRRVAWSLFALSTIAVALRFAARSSIWDGPGYGWDDWVMLGVLVVLIPTEVGLELTIQNGLGQDFWMLAPHWNMITNFLLYFWLSEMFYVVIINGTKIAILALYLRIFSSSTSTRFRIACYTLIGICVAATIGSVLSFVFECNPISGAWNGWNRESPAKCININTQVVSMASLNIALDLTIFVLPIPQVVKLNASIQKRVGVCMTFMVGLFVTIVSILRLWKLLQGIRDPTDPTWALNSIAIWSQAEMHVGIICACMPSFARLLKQFGSYVFGGLTSKTANYYYNGTSFSRRQQGTMGDKAHTPVNMTSRSGMSKTVETSVVYGRDGLGSADEIELVDKRSRDPVAEGQGYEHNYVRDW